MTPDKNPNLPQSGKRIFFHNLPEYVMYLLGFIIVYFIGIIYLIIFIIYCIFSTLWFMKFICTNCPHYDRLICPSGYAKVVSRLFKRGDFTKFQSQFKKHIAVVFPMWIVPAFVGVYLLIDEFTMWMLVLLILFIIDGFIILPIVTRRYGCNECELKDQCPWMGGFGK
jgi:hypothetical protein